MKRISIIALVLALPAMLFAATDGIFEYEVFSSEDGVIITSCNPESYQSEVQIPSTIDGLPVVRIADGFLVDDYVEVVSLPATLMYVSGAAFTGATALEAVTVHPDNPVYASIRGVLYDKVELYLVCYPQAKEGSSFAVPDGILVIGNYAFAETENLESVVLPDGLVGIGWNAFEDSSIRSVNFPDSLEFIYSDAFFNCNQLVSVSLPASLDYLGGEVFVGKELESISVDEANPKYRSIDGVLFSKDLYTLIAYPASRQYFGSYEIPEGVTRIDSVAFCYSMLDEILLPQSVQYIGWSAFWGSDIDEISLPDSITYIGDDAFSSCSYLDVIHVNEGSYAYEWVGTSEWARYLDYSPSWLEPYEEYPDFESVLGALGEPPAPTGVHEDCDVDSIVAELSSYLSSIEDDLQIGELKLDRFLSFVEENSGPDSGFFVESSGRLAIRESNSAENYKVEIFNGLKNTDGSTYWAYISYPEDQSIVALTVQEKDGTVFTIDAVFDFSLDACVSLCLDGVELVGDEPLSLDLFTGL